MPNRAPIQMAENPVTAPVIDSASGIGSVPNNQSVDYFGLRISMKPSTFLKLARNLPAEERRARSSTYLRDAMEEGRGIGPPTLYVEIPDGWQEGDFSEVAEVVGHEGRHRATTAMELFGDKPFEMHLFPKFFRRRHITPEWIEHLNTRLVSENGVMVRGPFFEVMGESMSRNPVGGVRSIFEDLGSPNVSFIEFSKGIEVEREHTDDLHEAGRIALDHLREFPDYYTRLLKMEERAKKGLPPNAKKQQHAAEVGLDWTKPNTWPDSIEHRQFAHDFRVLLEDHEFMKPSYDIVRIRLEDVTVPEIDYDDDRDLDPDTGEPSDAYMESLVAAMRSGVKMPPVVVGNVDEGSPMPWGYPYDGRHRLNAAKRLGLKWVPAIDVTGTGEDVVPNGHRHMPKVRDAFDECFDALVEQFPDFGDLELHQDEKAGSDNGHGSERQFGYCMDGDPMVIAFAGKIESMPDEYIRGLMRHEFGHALDFRYGKELGKMLGRRLPDGIERRADVIAECVFGDTIKYGHLDIQCVGCNGKGKRPGYLAK